MPGITIWVKPSWRRHNMRFGEKASRERLCAGAAEAFLEKSTVGQEPIDVLSLHVLRDLVELGVEQIELCLQFLMGRRACAGQRLVGGLWLKRQVGVDGARQILAGGLSHQVEVFGKRR